MKNVLKTSKCLRWTVAGAFGLMLTLNVMVGLEFEKGAMLPTLTLNELNSQSYAMGETAGAISSYDNPYIWPPCELQGFEPCGTNKMF